MFSKTIDPTSDTFTGAGASGEARKWALLPLENKAGIKALKFSKALYQMFEVLSSAWKKKGINLTPKDIEVKFDRNIPAELLLESQVQQNLAGIVSNKTRFSQASFIPDPEQEKKNIEEEAEGAVNLESDE